MAHLSLIIISIIITLVAFFLIIIYSTNKKFRAYPCYFNIIFTLTITFDNLIRLIPGGKGDDIGTDDKSFFCHLQAFSLTTFDKLMLALMTSYSIINFLGNYKTQYYRENEKAIFITLTIISLAISLICTIIFYFPGISNRSEFCYVETKSILKKIIDTIVTSFLLLISLFCIVKVLINIYKLKTEGRNINYHFYRFIADLIISSVTFTYVILLILKILPFDNYVKDLLFIILSLVVELFFTVNLELLKEIKRIITCSKVPVPSQTLGQDSFIDEEEDN